MDKELSQILTAALEAQSKGDHSRALARLKKGLLVAIQNADKGSAAFFASDIAALCDRMGRLSESAEFYQLAVAIKPNDPWAYLPLADSYARLGSAKLARRVLTACRRIAIRKGNLEVVAIVAAAKKHPKS